MQRIHLPYTVFWEILEITQKELYHQLTRVLRARVNQEVIFFDGTNQEDHLYIMVHINKNTVSFRKQKMIQKSSELLSRLTLYQAFPNKLEKIEYIVQKCCEIGYKEIIFFEAERSQILVLSDNKKERLKKIAIEAIEQCGGNIIPEIKFISSLSFEERDWGWGFVWKGTRERDISLLCHTSGKYAQKLSNISLEGREYINVLVGPEGGFSEAEVEAFEKVGMKQIYFGERILRTETVAPLLGFYLSQKKEA